MEISVKEFQESAKLIKRKHKVVATFITGMSSNNGLYLQGVYESIIKKLAVSIHSLNVKTVDHYNVAFILGKQTLHRMGFKVDFQPKSVVKGISANNWQVQF